MNSRKTHSQWDKVSLKPGGYIKAKALPESRGALGAYADHTIARLQKPVKRVKKRKGKKRKAITNPYLKRIEEIERYAGKLKSVKKGLLYAIFMKLIMLKYSDDLCPMDFNNILCVKREDRQRLFGDILPLGDRERMFSVYSLDQFNEAKKLILDTIFQILPLIDSRPVESTASSPLPPDIDIHILESPIPIVMNNPILSQPVKAENNNANI